MFVRIAAIGFIFAVTSVAWIILGTTIQVRTWERNPALREKVVSNWGGPHVQRRPTAYVELPPAGKESCCKRIPAEVESTRATADFHLEHRQKGLLWYSTYAVAFAGRWTFRNPTEAQQTLMLVFPFPAPRAIYDDLVLTVDGQPVQLKVDQAGATATAPVGPSAAVVLETRYKSQGLESWSYEFSKEVAEVKDFRFAVSTDFANPDFPEGALSPTDKQRTQSGWKLTWAYRNLMSGQQIRIVMPEKLQPGPLAGQISYFAPVSLLFFFFVIFMVTTLRGVNLHPMHYFFLAASFFAFHLLMAYLVDHVSIHVAFAAASIVSLFLTVSYLRLVTGLRFAVREAAMAQFIYLVLFSYAFFFEGFTGLAVTIGAIVTLFVTMQMTGRVDWSQLRLNGTVEQTG